MPGSDKRKQSLYIPLHLLKKLKTERDRQDRTLSWLVQQCIKIALPEIQKYPGINHYTGEDAERDEPAQEPRPNRRA